MATLFPDHADLYHTGIVVHDLEKAKAEMSGHLGLTWGVSEPASRTRRRRS